MGIIDDIGIRTMSILKNMANNRQEECIDTLLDIIKELLSTYNQVIKQKEHDITNQIYDILQNFNVCVQLLSMTYNPVIVDKASGCLI